MTTFYICRHGQTEYNLQGRLSGWVDTPLTEEGVKNVQSTIAKIQHLSFDEIHSSDLGRAFVTAYLISRSMNFTREITRSKSLREVSYGDLAGIQTSVGKSKYGADRLTNFIAPGGESLAQMQERAIRYLAGLNKVNSNQTILIVAHEGVINAVCAKFENVDLGTRMDTTLTPHDYVGKFEIENGQISVFSEVRR